MAVASLVLGIISIFTGFFGVWAFIGTICGVIGLILAIIAKKKDPESGAAKGGLITSIAGIVISIAVFSYCTYQVAQFTKAMGDPKAAEELMKKWSEQK
ncbi:MAG: hypothetical protein GY754_15690 [bacterium]|nr:hypothetical protein [bacterium]